MRTQGKPNLAPRTPQVVDAEFEGESVGLQTVAPAAMQFRSSYMTAQVVTRPRDLAALSKKVESEAELAGEHFFYAWTVTNRRDGTQSLIEGMSIDGAMILIRNFGNCVAEVRVVQDSPSHWLLEATFVDLETGFTLTRLYRQRKSEAHQKSDGDRLQDIAFQIGQSKAIRNVVDKAMPGWLIAKAMDRAKKGAETAYENIPEWVGKAERAFAVFKVTPAELERKIGRPRDLWTSADIRVLIAIERAIRARETSVDAEFRADVAPAPNADGVTPPPPAVASKTVAAVAPTAPAPQAAVVPVPPPAAAPAPAPRSAPVEDDDFAPPPRRRREPGEEG